MKFLNIFLSVIFCFFGSFFLNPTQKNTSVFNGNIEHIFIHSLIAYPEILRQKSPQTISLYKKDCIDYIEFKNLLNELYKNNYVLIDIHKTYTVENGIAKKTKVRVPTNKKPLVLSVDDVVYDPRKSGNGMVDKLIVKNNKVASQTKIDGADTISFDREFAPILENFIETHKDFSFENARATINLTGFCGILGYRISSDNEKIARTEKAKAKVVVSKLKSLGYNFACHSYGHYHIKKVDTNYVKKDLLDWKQKIEPIIGKTDIFVFPYGEWEIATQTGLTQKQKLLCDYGFNLFLGVGMKNFYDYMPFNINIKDKILLWDRKNIDNYSLIHNQKYVSKLFDCEKILSSFSKQK